MPKKNKQTALLWIILSVLFSFAIPVLAQGENWSTSDIIVKLKDTDKMMKNSMEDASTEIRRPIFFKVSPEPGETIDDLLNRYRNDANVEYAEPNICWSMHSLPNDPYYPNQWALPKINIPKAWEKTRGNANVVVAILDTGVDIYHPDLAGRMIDGYNAITREEGYFCTQDDQGHGTHVAGTISAYINNGIGISGIADNIKILPVKVLDYKGEGGTDNISEGIIWAVDHNADVINLSLGSNERSNLVEDAIAYAHSKGAVIVASAGNTGQRGVLFPAASPCVIGVSATDSLDLFSTRSSFGAEVDLSAPGVDIYSTIWSNGVSGYGSLSGTSMSASFVSGITALIFSIYPQLTNEQVEIALKETSFDLGISGWDEKYGHGRIDANSALKYVEENFIPNNYNIAFDLNWDGLNNLEDLFHLGKHYGEKKENSIFDLNHDGVTDIYDMVILTRHF